MALFAFGVRGHGETRAKASRPGKRPHAQSRARTGVRRPRGDAIEAALAGIAHDIRTPLTGIVALGRIAGLLRPGHARARLGGGDQERCRSSCALTTLIVDAAKAERHRTRAAQRAILAARACRSGRRGARRARRQQGAQGRHRRSRAICRPWYRAMCCGCARRWKI